MTSGRDDEQNGRRDMLRWVSRSGLSLLLACGLVHAQTPPGADDGQWTRAARDYASTRFSGLDQVNAGNVARLRLAFNFSTGVVRGHEAAPIVADNTMFIV